MSVQVVGLVDVGAVLPARIDLFIGSASYEERCLSIPLHMPLERVEHAIVAQNANHSELHGGHAEVLLDLFEERGDWARLDTRNPLRTADALQAALPVGRSGEEDLEVVVDITTFTHEACLILFALLRAKLPRANVTYVYAPASEYSVGDRPEEKWLSAGVAEVRAILGYSGYFLPGRPLHMIVLAGLEDERVVELIRAYEPARISVGFGVRGTGSTEAAHRHKVDAIRAVFAATQEFQFGVFDPLGTEAVVAGLAEETGVNAVVVAMNTKLSSIGAALAAEAHPRIQLAYAEPMIYNVERYSSPGDSCMAFTPSRPGKLTEGERLGLALATI